MMKSLLSLLFIGLASSPLYAARSDDSRLGSKVDLSIPFSRENGKDIKLDSLLAGRPSILAMTYFSCPNLCPILLRSLAQALSKIPAERMAETNVIIVSFDPREGPMDARKQSQHFLRFLPAHFSQTKIHFLTGGLFSIDRLARDLSFEVSWDAASKTYSHASGLAVLSGTGQIISFFDGLDFPRERIEESLVQAQREKPLSGWDRFLIACAEGQLLGHKDSARILSIIRSISGVFILLTGLIIGLSFARRRRPSV